MEDAGYVAEPVAIILVAVEPTVPGDGSVTVIGVLGLIGVPGLVGISGPVGIVGVGVGPGVDIGGTVIGWFIKGPGVKTGGVILPVATVKVGLLTATVIGVTASGVDGEVELQTPRGQPFKFWPVRGK